MAADLETVLENIGPFGCHQIVNVLIIQIVHVFISMQSCIVVFVAYAPKWSCPSDSLSVSTSSPTQLKDMCQTPFEGKCCLANGTLCPGASFNSEISSIATEWKLVCSDAYFNELVQSLFVCGMMIGITLLGGIADKYGRKKTWVISTVLGAAVSLLSGFSWSYYFFAFLRFVAGILFGGAGLVMFVLVTEPIGPSYRGFVGAIHNGCSALSYPLLAFLAYNIRGWRALLVISSAPLVLLLLLHHTIPESPRWLLVQGRVYEAEEVLRTIAAGNGRQEVDISLEFDKQQFAKSRQRGHSMCNLITHRGLFKITVIMMVVWCANGLIYYGLTLNVKNLEGNLYVNFGLSGLVEIPSIFLILFLISHFDRRKSVFLFMLGATVACYICMKLQDKGQSNAYMLSSVAMLGKFCISASFTLIYIYSAELFPTVIRNIGMGVASSSARIGSTMAPFVVLLSEWSPSMPMFVFATVGAIATVLALYLPETKGRPLPETIDDIDQPMYQGTLLLHKSLE